MTAAYVEVEEYAIYVLIAVIGVLLPPLTWIAHRRGLISWRTQVRDDCVVRCSVVDGFRGMIVLAAYRGFIVVYSVLVVVAAFFLHGVDYFTYFTLWNYSLLTLYFVVVLVASAEALVRQRRGAKASPFGTALATNSTYGGDETTDRGDGGGAALAVVAAAQPPVFVLHCTAFVLLNVLIVMAVLIDLMVWCVLVPGTVVAANNCAPSASSCPSIDEFISFVSFSAHGFNFFFLLFDLLLSNIPMRYYTLLFSLMWGIAYLVFQLIFYAAGGWWVYPFLDVTNDGSLLWYLLLLALIAVFHLFSVGVWQAKVRLLRRYKRGYAIDGKDFVLDNEQDYLSFH